ncbi:MAG TPA: DNA mismatch repair protein MutS [Planctomycetota bacterium]|nr:DNA mismatch repair protein MutS [Planctomycetota bacterium]
MIREKEDPALETPMMRQYLSVKEKYAEEIIFFRMGDFYEMFFDDARDASEILGIALTSRSKDRDAIPMAGVPVRAVDSYLPRLLKAGRRVAICEQMGDPRDARGLVEREVVRVISPGTVTDEKIVGEKSNNFICAVVQGKSAFGLAWLDVTTGLFLVWESPSLGAVSEEVSRLDPAECLLPEALNFSLDRHRELALALDGVARTPYPDPLFEYTTARGSLVEHFRTHTLEGFGCEGMEAAVQAGGGLLHYVEATQKDSLKHITKVSPFQASRHLPIDRSTRRALELMETSRGGGAGTLLHTLDVTSTALGARMFREWMLAPLTDVSAIRERQDAVAELVTRGELRESLAERLREVHDLERISTRLSYQSATPRDLAALRRTMDVIPGLRDALSTTGAAFLRAAGERMSVLPEDLRDRLAAAIVDSPPLAVREGGIIRPGFDPELDETREIATQGTLWIARFQEEEVRRTGIGSLKVGFNKVFGYYIEVTNTHREKIPEDYIRKQTLKNCERFVTAPLKEYEAKVLNARERVAGLEFEIFTRLRNESSSHIPAFQAAAQAVAEVDVVTAFATTATRRGYVRPQVNDGTRLHIEDGRHPVVEAAAATDAFVPNSVDLDSDRSVMIITGPNMAGKSTYIRQVAILTLLAQTGSFLPAARAEIGVVDRIFTRVGASDDLTRGQSTFMVEMNETANILNNATSRSLIVLDEVGRGTSTFDGVSLAWAITEHIAEKIKARTLFATHYHELTALARAYPTIRNFNCAVKEWNEDIIFLRKIVEGGSDKSYGIHVARLAGIPRSTVERAKEVLSRLESQSFDLEDGPVLAARRGVRKPTRQLDLFQDSNDLVLKELRRLDTDSMTPAEALQRITELRARIV